RGRGAPHVEAADTVRLMLSVLAQCPQSHAERAPNALWPLKYQHATHDQVVFVNPNEIHTKRIALQPPAPEVAEKTFGDLVTWGGDEARTEQGRSALLREVESLSCWQDGRTAMIRFRDGRQWWYGAGLTNAIAPSLHSAEARTMTTVPIILIGFLADLVND